MSVFTFAQGSWLGLHSWPLVSDAEVMGAVTVLFVPLPVDTQSDNFSPVWVKGGVQTSFAFRVRQTSSDLDFHSH